MTEEASKLTEDEVQGGGMEGCNCRKSKCLKLYVDWWWTLVTESLLFFITVCIANQVLPMLQCHEDLQRQLPLPGLPQHGRA